MSSRRGHNEGTSMWVGQMLIDTHDGQKRRTFYGKTKREAQARLSEVKLAKQQGHLSLTTRQTLGQFLDGWLALVATSVRPTTYASYDLNVRRAKRYMGNQRLATLKPADVQRWYSQLQSEHLSAYSVLQARRVLHIALDDAVDWELISRNPVDATKSPRIEFREKNWLRPHEAIDFLTKTADHPLHALWVLLPTAGLRIGEALALTWDDYDPDARSIRVERAVQRQKGKGLVFVDTKTDRSRRTVYLTQFATDALTRHRGAQDAQRTSLGNEWIDSNLVFCTPFGGLLDGTNVYRSLQRMLARYGLRRIGLHELRHSAASIMLAEGVPLKVVQEILGH
jgi:integrase